MRYDSHRGGTPFSPDEGCRWQQNTDTSWIPLSGGEKVWAKIANTRVFKQILT
jgi:hypothetical protein